MADHIWRKERIRSYLLSYNELLYFLKKYPKASPYKLTKDVSTQTSPHLFKQTYNKLNSRMKEISVSTSPTEILSPSPHTKYKTQCNPITPSKFKAIKTMHASAIKVSDSLFNTLINHNTSNDNANQTQNNKINRKRTYQQLNNNNTQINQLNNSFSGCNININKNNQPLKKRKISKEFNNKNINKNPSPKEIRKKMLLNFYNMNNDQKSHNNIGKKAIKHKLIRYNDNNNNIKKQLNYNDSYESIESSSPPSYSQFKSAKKNNKTLKKTKSKMSIIPRCMNRIVNDSDDNIFDLLPELDEEDIKKCDELINNSIISNDNFEEKQMSNEIIRFENELLNNESICNNSNNNNNNSNWETFIVRKEKHKYTPLWKASVGRDLPNDEKCFDINKLRVNNNKCPLDKYDYKYLNNDNMSPKTKMAQYNLKNNLKNSYESECNEEMNITHSQIINKYQNNVSCFGGNVNVNICSEDNSESKVSLFDNTNFSEEQTKINSLLRDNGSMDDEICNVNSNYNGKNKYSIFEYPSD